MTDSSVADGRYVPTQIDLTAQARTIELLRRLTNRGGPTVDANKASDVIQKLLDEPRPREFNSFTLDDRIDEHMDVLGLKVSKALLRTGIITRFRHLTIYPPGFLVQIKDVGPGTIRHIERALASVGAELNPFLDASEYQAMYRRVIPRKSGDGDGGFTEVYLGEHEDIGFSFICRWAGITATMSLRSKGDTRLQNFGDMLKCSRKALEDIIFGWEMDTCDYSRDELTTKFAEDSVAKLKAYVDSTRIPWERFNDDLHFSNLPLDQVIYRVLSRHDLHKLSDLRRFVGSGVRLTDIDPGLSIAREKTLIETLESLGAPELARLMKTGPRPPRSEID